MGGGEELHPWGDLARRANSDRRHIKHDRVDIDERAVANADRPVLAVERRAHDDLLANLPQHLTEQPVALVPCGRPSPVEAREELLDPRELGLVLRIIRDVQLATEHPLPHFAHASASSRGTSWAPPPSPRQASVRNAG